MCVHEGLFIVCVGWWWNMLHSMCVYMVGSMCVWCAQNSLTTGQEMARGSVNGCCMSKTKTIREIADTQWTRGVIGTMKPWYKEHRPKWLFIIPGSASVGFLSLLRLLTTHGCLSFHQTTASLSTGNCGAGSHCFPNAGVTRSFSFGTVSSESCYPGTSPVTSQRLDICLSRHSFRCFSSFHFWTSRTWYDDRLLWSMTKLGGEGDHIL